MGPISAAPSGRDDAPDGDAGASYPAYTDGN